MLHPTRRRPRPPALPGLLALAAIVVMVCLLLVVGPVSATPAHARDEVEPAPPVTTFRVASFNILGSNHTVGSTRWEDGRTRARMARRWLDRQGVSVVGLQEAQVDQARMLTRAGEWASYPDPRTSVNTQTAQSVAWRVDQWELVEASTFRIPFHLSQVREQPVVRLRHVVTGAETWVTSLHLTAGGGERGAHERKVGTRRLIRQVERLAPSWLPVLVTGDMNGHREFFCRVARRTALHAPHGGGWDGGCRPPSPMRVDWLLATPGVTWGDFRYADGGRLDRITDHTVPVATVTLPTPLVVRSVEGPRP